MLKGKISCGQRRRIERAIVQHANIVAGAHKRIACRVTALFVGAEQRTQSGRSCLFDGAGIVFSKARLQHG